MIPGSKQKIISLRHNTQLANENKAKCRLSCLIDKLRNSATAPESPPAVGPLHCCLLTTRIETLLKRRHMQEEAVQSQRGVELVAKCKVNASTTTVNPPAEPPLSPRCSQLPKFGTDRFNVKRYSCIDVIQLVLQLSRKITTLISQTGTVHLCYCTLTVTVWLQASNEVRHIMGHKFFVVIVTLNILESVPNFPK